MTSKTTVTPSPPTAEERALQSKQLELATFQLTELQKQSTLQEQFVSDIGPLLEQQTADAELARERSEKLFPIQEELLQLALDDIRRGGAATPEQIELIEEAADAGIAAGGFDIERFRTESLGALREELAPSLGLRPSDTPILDRGARVAAEATRQGGQLAQRFRAGAATARLNFPLAQSQLLQASALGQQSLAESTRQFQEGLRQSAFINRLNLQSSVGGLGLGLATGTSVSFPGFQRGSTTSKSGFGFSDIAGIGSLLSGAGAVGGLFAPGSVFGSAAAAAAPLALASSRDFKEDLGLVDEERILEDVKKLPIKTWKYKTGLGLGEERHIGPMAEDFTETLGLGDPTGKTIPVVDAIGIGLAATKGLAKKVERIEHSLGLTAAPEGLGLAKAA